MAPRPRHGLSLCAGGGGLDMGLMLAEPGFHTRCFVEWDEYPRRSLIAAQAAGYFAPAPIWSDVTTFDGKPFRGAIDTILAGYPCQPFSQAGQRKGADDERHLWPHVARIIREIDPEWAFLENVAGHVSLGLETVLRDLWDMGLTPAAGLFSAAETGAPHERLRVFIVAHGDSSKRVTDGRKPDAGTTGRDNSCWCGGAALDNPTSPRRSDTRRGPDERGNGNERGQPMLGDGCAELDHTPRVGRREGWTEPELRRGRDTAGSADGTMANAGGRRSGGSAAGQDQQSGRAAAVGAGAAMADASKPGLEGRERRGPSDERDRSPAHGPASERCRPWIHPPGPADMAGWADTIAVAPYLAPSASFGDCIRFADEVAAMVEAGMVAEAAAEPALRRMADGLAARSRALRLLGNGVHPLAAGYAWRTLSAAHGLGAVDMEAVA